MDLNYCLEALRLQKETAAFEKQLRKSEFHEVETPVIFEVNVVKRKKPIYIVRYRCKPIRSKERSYRCLLSEKFIAKL